MHDPKSPTSLIRTKLRLPFTRPGLVSRPRLQGQVALGLRGPLTLITAPAGFGKTTLVTACITESRVPAAWLSLDKNDNQPGRFLTYLAAALQVADARIGGEAVQRMAGVQQAAPEAVLTSLINDLDSTGTELILVLDDYQLITSPAVHEQVAFLLHHLPATFHLVIATRSDPPLPLARLRARGQVVELRAADLRFTGEEAVQFLNDVMDLHLDMNLIAALEARTEGWIAGLQMAAIALQAHLSTRSRKDALGFIDRFSGTHRFILDYLLEEVLTSQPAEIQHFLLYTSILERLSAPLCDALLAEERLPGLEAGPAASPQTSASILKYLEHENLFLVALDDDLNTPGAAWFRYHHLFSDLLRARLLQTQADRIHTLHCRASAWLEQNGFISEAIQHRFAAHEDERAADLIERFGPACWAQSDPSVVQQAENLPPSLLLARPRLGIYLAWLLLCQGRVERTIALLGELAEPGRPAPAGGPGWAPVVIALARSFLNPHARQPGFDPLSDDRVLDEIPEDETILRDAAEILFGMALARRGEIDRAAAVSARCIERRGKAAQARQVPSLVPFLARVSLMQGRLHAAAALCREYLDPPGTRGSRFIHSPGSLEIVLGEALYEWNCLDEAETQIRDGLKADGPWQNIMTSGFGLLALARVLQAKGEHAGALQTAEQFETRMQTPLRPGEFTEDLLTLRARLLLAAGDLSAAGRWAEQVRFSEDYHLHPQFYQLTLARVDLALGRYAEVEAMLTRLPPQDPIGSRIARQVEIYLLQATAAAGQGRLDEALAGAGLSIALAEPEGYIRVFLDAGEPARELLVAYRKSNPTRHSAYVQTVLDAFPPAQGAREPGRQPDGLVEPLSEREMEVLRLMAQGKTNPEIARMLVVAGGTIKAHAASIYRKLDAANRTEAVAKARRVGILS